MVCCSWSRWRYLPWLLKNQCWLLLHLPALRSDTIKHDVPALRHATLSMLMTGTPVLWVQTLQQVHHSWWEYQLWTLPPLSTVCIHAWVQIDINIICTIIYHSNHTSYIDSTWSLAVTFVMGCPTGNSEGLGVQHCCPWDIGRTCGAATNSKDCGRWSGIDVR